MDHDVCRICTSNSSERTSLFDLSEEVWSLSETGRMFTCCFRIDIEPLAEYPNYICNYCKLQLTVFYNFMLMAQKSHDKFTKEIETAVATEIFEKEDEIEEEFQIENAESIDIKSEISENSENSMDEVENCDEMELEEQLSGGSHNDEFYQIEYLFDNYDPTETTTGVTKSDVEPSSNSLDVSDETLADQTDDECALSETNYDELIEEEEEEQEAFDEDNKLVNDSHKNETEDKIITCTKCGVTLANAKEHKLHWLKTHTPSKVFQCGECGKKLKSQEMYESHMNVHKGLPAFKCADCEKTFNYRINYQTHLLSHTNVRPYSCSRCEKAFRSKWDLIIHTRVHLDIRKHECKICLKKFRVSSHLKTHQYTHFEKQFECDQCNQKYISPRTLKQHKNTVHSTFFAFSCEFCDKKFKRKHHIMNHLKTHDKTG